MLTVTAPVGQRAAHGPQYQHSSTCMYAFPDSGLMASESSGQMSTHSVQPCTQSEASMVTGTSALDWVRGKVVSLGVLGRLAARALGRGRVVRG